MIEYDVEKYLPPDLPEPPPWLLQQWREDDAWWAAHDDGIPREPTPDQSEEEAAEKWEAHLKSLDQGPAPDPDPGMSGELDDSEIVA